MSQQIPEIINFEFFFDPIIHNPTTLIKLPDYEEIYTCIDLFDKPLNQVTENDQPVANLVGKYYKFIKPNGEILHTSEKKIIFKKIVNSYGNPQQIQRAFEFDINLTSYFINEIILPDKQNIPEIINYTTTSAIPPQTTFGGCSTLNNTNGSVGVMATKLSFP